MNRYSRIGFILVVALSLGFVSNLTAQAKKNEGHSSTIEDVNTNVQAFIGKRVTLTGKVEKLLMPNLFVLNGPGILNDEIVVVVKKQSGRPMDRKEGASPVENSEVEVTGSVKKMTLLDVQKEYNLTLDTEIEIEKERTMPILVAESKDIVSVVQPD